MRSAEASSRPAAPTARFCAAKTRVLNGRPARFLRRAASSIFRGVWAWDAQNAVVLASGPGARSRIYKTLEWLRLLAASLHQPRPRRLLGCDHLLEPKALPDCRRPRTGANIIGPIEFPIQPARRSPIQQGRLPRTGDRGWRPELRQLSPMAGASLKAPAGATIFAASNSALFTLDDMVWFATGGKPPAEVYQAKMPARKRTEPVFR